MADLRIPATFYVASDFIDFNRMSWIDRIEWALEPAPPATLRLPWGEVRFSDDASKRAALDDIRRHVKQDRTLSPDAIASDIQLQVGNRETWSSEDPLDRKMTWDQVRTLGRGFTIGGYSHSYAILSFLGPGDLKFEIDTPLEMLKNKAGMSSTNSRLAA